MPNTLLDLIPADATIEQDGKPVPMRDLAYVKETPDIQTFVKRFADTQSELGRRIRLPGKDAKPEEVQAARAKLVEAGLIDTPPSEYKISAPDPKAPEAPMFSQDQVNAFLPVAKELGLTQKQVEGLIGYDLKRMAGYKTSLDTDAEKGLATLKQEFGAKYDALVEDTKRFTPMIFKTEDEVRFFEQMGIANHPTFLGVMMRLAPLIKSDSSLMESLQQTTAGKVTREQAKAELADIMSNKENPKYAGYHRQPTPDPEVMKYIDDLYRKAAPGAVDIAP